MKLLERLTLPSAPKFVSDPGYYERFTAFRREPGVERDNGQRLAFHSFRKCVVRALEKALGIGISPRSSRSRGDASRLCRSDKKGGQTPFGAALLA
jgi:hypothetical protein